MSTQRIRSIFTISLVILDAILIAVAFFLAYQVRVTIDWPEPLANQVPLSDYMGLLLLQEVTILFVLFLNRQYYIPRSASRIDQLYYVFISVSVGMLMSVALATLIFRNNQAILDYPRAMLVYAWAFTIILLTLGRVFHQWLRSWLRDRGIGKDRVLVVGTGDTARMMLQRIVWSPQLGYDVVGIIDGNGESTNGELLEIPIIGRPEDLPTLITEKSIDTVIIAVPEKGHRETLRIISYCERGRVTIKVFPDLFQYITSQAGIDDLGGLPLLSIRDYALRGYSIDAETGD
ncbi:MAG: hypothetical protein R3C44_08040 [Chloroflexota bacterium]